MEILECDNCSEEIIKPTSKVRELNFCDKDCRHKYYYAELVCDTCLKTFEKNKNLLRDNNFCSKKCFLAFARIRMSKMNVEINHTRMTPETRKKVREARLNSGEGKTYSKYYGRHTHRVVAEEMLGRPLREGEIVHHKDGNKRNNDPDNLEVLASQAEHARIHAIEMWEDGTFRNRRNYRTDATKK